MLSIALVKLFFAVCILLITWAAGFVPYQKRIKNQNHLEFPIGDTLATGVFLGAALLHMMPESAKMFRESGYHFPFSFMITGAVFLFFLWFEHLIKEFHQHEHDHHKHHHHQHPAFAILAWVMLSIHALILGAALGLSHHQSVIIMLFLAIMAHKWAESFALSVQLNKSAMKTTRSMMFFIAFSLMTPLGIFLGWYLGHGLKTQSLFDPVLIAASAGTFLYLGTLHGLDRCVMVERCCNLRDFSFVIIGFLMMAGVACYV